MHMHVTQRQIAAEAGVSQCAVGYALSDDPAAHAELRPETRQRIIAVAERLGYRKNRYAQVMRRGRSGLIGVLHNTGLLQIAMLKTTAAIEAIYARGYRPLSGDALWVPALGKRNAMETVCESLLDARVEGLLLVHVRLEGAERRRWLSSGIPIAQISGSDSLPGCPNVRADVRQGMSDLVRHLLRLGHRRMTMLAYQPKPRHQSWPSRERMIGFHDTLREAGAPAGRVIFSQSGEANWAEPYVVGNRLMARLLAEKGPRPDVVICQNDDWAHGAFAACAAAGVRVPEDLALAGFDGAPLGAFGTVSLTTVAQPTRELSFKAVDLLVRMIKGEAPSADEKVIKLPCEVVVRQSCGKR